MQTVNRILPASPIESLAAYVEGGGGRGLEAARAVAPEVVIDLLEDAGLRGRGGAGFSLARKWRAVLRNESDVIASSVVVNGAEGEPGAFKDRTIVRANPYHVLEGALIAASVLDAGEIIVAMKRSSLEELARIDRAIGEMRDAGWFCDVDVRSFGGPGEYLYGEETALLEAIDGRPPFPRIAPPFRRGVEEVVEYASDLHSGSGLAAHVEMAGPDHIAPPTFASNVETFANLPGILANGSDWYRELGTDDSPGTIVCTVSGDTVRAGVAEVPLGTPLSDVILTIGGGMRDGKQVGAVMSGVSNPLIPASEIDVPLTYEAVRAIGAGLGCAGFIVFDDTTDFVAVAAGVARFLAVESCGQCAHCKRDGLAIADKLARLARSEAKQNDLDLLDRRLASVADGARCNLASQQQTVVGSILSLFPIEVGQHREHRGEPAPPTLIAEITAIEEGRAHVDERHAEKQPDWTYDVVDSGQWPADRLRDHRARVRT